MVSESKLQPSITSGQADSPFQTGRFRAALNAVNVISYIDLWLSMSTSIWAHDPLNNIRLSLSYRWK